MPTIATRRSGVLRGLIHIAAAALLLAACGTSNSPAASPNLASDFLRVDSALAKLSADVSMSTPEDDLGALHVATIRGDCKMLYNSSIKLSADLLAFKKNLSRNGQAHAEAARDALSQEIADLKLAIASTTDADLYRALNAFRADVDSGAAAFVLVRADLGLRPPDLRSRMSTPSPT